MKEKILRKLHNQAGETIGETLVALLISSLALVMLAGAISSAANVITRSNNTMAAYYKSDNALAEQTGTSETTITIGSYPSYTVTYTQNNTFSKTPVIAYKKK